MKKMIWLTLFCVLMGWPLARAQEQPAAEVNAESAGQAQTQELLLDKIGDWFATVGKSEEEKAAILAERRLKQENESGNTFSEWLEAQKQAVEQAFLKIIKKISSIASGVKEEFKKKAAQLKERAASMIEEGGKKKEEEIKNKTGVTAEDQKDKLQSKTEDVIDSAGKAFFKTVSDWLK
ncbi:MAG: hypothetical protein JW847_00915 [Candidatus Omnitrophica bacterium]|nr:hypothetical protein [Candidatus Omnitrophota bacterium]